MAIPTKQTRFFLIIVSMNLVLLFTCLSVASAETAAQPATALTTTISHPMSLETDTQQSPSATALTTTISHTVSLETDTQQNPSASNIPPQPQAGKAPKPAAQAKSTIQLGPQVDPCFTVSVAGDNWLDQVHDYVQDNTCEPAVWFDTFFVKDHVLLDLRPGAFITLRNSARFTEGGTLANLTDYHLEWRLPQWEKYLKKMKLYVQSRSVAGRYTTQPGQPVEPGVDRATGVRKTTIGVRADLYTRLRALISIESGAKIGAHPDAYVRMRYQYVRPFDKVYLFRFSEIAMYQAVEHFTNTVQLDVERTFTPFTFARWGNNITFVAGKSGITWNSGVSLFTQLSPKSAISYDTSTWGVNDPGWNVQNYRIGVLYRRNFYRSYLFYELAPEITFPKDADGHRNSVYAFMATLEVQFGK